MTLEAITADALAPLRHGFFTRKGGASSGVFGGLNCGPGSSDQAEIVALNRARAAAALDVAPERLVTLHQVHSAEAVALDAPPATRPRADGMATATPGLALGVLTADCMPVLLADRAAGVIGAAHAGWRGARAGVLEATLARMAELGAEAARVTAVIGPAISQSAYEVGPEVMATFLADSAGNARFFARGDGDRVQFDLPAYGLARLRAAGVGQAEWVGACTYADPDRFYSYRRATHAAEADYGRLLSAIRL